MARAPASGRTLNAADAALVKGMILRGDRQHDIAAYFAVNGGRIGETSTGAKFAAVPAARSDLPPEAPYLVIAASYRSEVETMLKELVAAKTPGRTLERIQGLIRAMEASRIARRGK
jgi:hypothetical protein